MSTIWRENYFFSRIFKKRRKRVEFRKDARLYRSLNFNFEQIDFRMMNR